jgi:hypothetical protein
MTYINMLISFLVSLVLVLSFFLTALTIIGGTIAFCLLPLYYSWNYGNNSFETFVGFSLSFFFLMSFYYSFKGFMNGL